MLSGWLGWRVRAGPVSITIIAGAPNAPGHLARATLFLAADESDGMTGQHVLVDAGIAQQSVVTSLHREDHHALCSECLDQMPGLRQYRGQLRVEPGHLPLSM